MKFSGTVYVGDSITEGYGDGQTISCFGVPGRNRRDYLLTGSLKSNHINLGQSGFMVRQYLKRFYGYVNADPTSVSVAVVSVWTPNKPYDQPASYSTESSVLADNKAALIECEAFCVQHGIIFIPVFWCASPFDLVLRAPLLKAGLDELKALWPWLIDANTVIQDPLVITGPCASSDWCSDATHPSGYGPDPESTINGYEMIRLKFNSDYVTSLPTAKAYYNILDV